MTDSPSSDPSLAPFSRNVFLVLIAVAVVLPPLGMLIGAFNMDKPARRRQSQLLLGIGLVVIVLAVLAAS